MKSKKFLFLLSLSLILMGCRRDDGLGQEITQEVGVKRIPFFENYEKNKNYKYKEPWLNYKDASNPAVPFAQALKTYLRNNPEFVARMKEKYGEVDFGVTSQLIERGETGQVGVFFPIKKSGKYTAVVFAVVNKNRSHFFFDIYKAEDGEVGEILKFFEKYARQNQVSKNCNFGGEEILCFADEVVITVIREGKNPFDRSLWNPFELGGGSSFGGFFDGDDWGGGGGGGRSGNSTPKNTPPNNDPCGNIKVKQKDSRYTDRFNKLSQKEMFNQKREFGAFERAKDKNTPSNTEFVDLEGKKGDTHLDLPDNRDGIYGLMHIHDNREGVVKIFSPTDVRTFINILLGNAKAYQGSYAAAYSTVITSQGSYTLKYSGEIHPGGINWQKAQEWETKYIEMFESLEYYTKGKYTQQEVENVFMQFMTEVVNIKGLEVFKVEATASNRMTYNESRGEAERNNPCY